MSIYYSIDLDFWQPAREFDSRFFRRLFSSGLPISVVVHHHHLLPHVNNHKFHTLLNLDFHSDVVLRSTDYISAIQDPTQELPEQCARTALNCGNWLTYVNNDRARNLVWSYPVDDCVDTNNYFNGWTHDHAEANPFTVTDSDVSVGWEHITAEPRLFPRLRDVSAIGIAISPKWSGRFLTDKFIAWMRRAPMRMLAADENCRKVLLGQKKLDYNDPGQ